MLIKQRTKAKCLLRLVLGARDDGEGLAVLASPVASSLPTLPFTNLKVLCQLEYQRFLVCEYGPSRTIIFMLEFKKWFSFNLWHFICHKKLQFYSKRVFPTAILWREKWFLTEIGKDFIVCPISVCIWIFGVCCTVIWDGYLFGLCFYSHNIDIFCILQLLYQSSPLTTDDGITLRRTSMQIGALHLVLACLSALSHHKPRRVTKSAEHEELTNAATLVSKVLCYMSDYFEMLG